MFQKLKLYELLKNKIGEKDAEAFIQILESKVDTRLEEKTSVFATKEDIAKLETKIAETKSDIVRWVFSFFVALMLAVIGLYFRR